MVSSHSLDDDDGGDDENTEDWLQSPGECPRVHTVLLAAGAGLRGPPPEHRPPCSPETTPACFLLLPIHSLLLFIFLDYYVPTPLWFF